MDTILFFLFLLGGNAGALFVVHLRLSALDRRLARLLDGQIILVEFAIKGGEFLSTIQNVQVMARRDFDEETMQ